MATGAVKIAVSPVTLYKSSTVLTKPVYQAQAWWNENETNHTNHHILASRKGGIWKNESLSESFGSRWASKVKINAYYQTMKVFFDLACMSTCCWGSQIQNMNLSLPIIGALLKCHLFIAPVFSVIWLFINRKLWWDIVAHLIIFIPNSLQLKSQKIRQKNAYDYENNILSAKSYKS